MNDEGFTCLPGGLRLKKSDALVCALGSLDELNAALGLLRATLAGHPDSTLIESIQRQVMRIGGELATGTPQFDADAAAALEHEAGRRTAGRPLASGFVLPGANEALARCHWARAVCRRTERDLVRAQDKYPERVTTPALDYLNRLSGLLFALGQSLDT